MFLGLVSPVLIIVFMTCRIFVFQCENMRNNKLKIVREAWSHSKFFIGKNRVLAKALGNSEEEEYSDKLHLISKCLKNECGLLMTNQSEEEVVDYFSRLSEPDFARTGGLATQTVELQQGVLNMFSHSMEPQLRKLGEFITVEMCRAGLTLQFRDASPVGEGPGHLVGGLHRLPGGGDTQQ